VTSRIVGYEHLGGEFQAATLEPFTDSQMEDFFNRWLCAVEKGEDILAEDQAIERRAQRRAVDLIGQIRANPGIRSLAANPLLCTIIGLIHRQGGALPQHRVELYKLCVDTFIFNWEMHKRRRGLAEPGLDKDETQAVLEVIALHLHQHGVENRASRAALEGVIKDHLVMQRGLPARDAEHKAIQLLDLVRDVAGLLVDRGEVSYGFFHLAFQEYLTARAITRKREVIPRYLEHRLLNPRWREVFRLASAHQGLKDEETGSQFIESVRTTPHPREAEMRYAFRLAFLCGRETRMEIETVQKLWADWTEIYFRQPWLQEQLREIVRTPGLDSGYRQGTLDWLLQALRDKDSDVRRAAAHALGAVRERAALEPLLEALRDEHSGVREAAAQALGNLGEGPALEPLLEALRDEDSDVRFAALNALLGLAKQAALDPLLQALRDGDAFVRSGAALPLVA
ncbi:MAG: HEAT repeat domain-containing protein, partial [Acidobacteria bacterium]|nr:HEAT repeat domain-containing protein [Acidobacteriota bacterium]